MTTKALQLNGILVSACRYMGIFTDQEQSSGSQIDTTFALWLLREAVPPVAHTNQPADEPFPALY